MINSADRMFYLDPLQDPFHTSDKMLVFREKYPRSYQPAKGNIVEVKDRVVTDHHLWWKTIDGMYVDGALVSPKEFVSYRTVMGIISDDLFVIGTSGGLTDEGDGPRMQITNARRSDGRTLTNTEGGIVRTYLVDTWMQAADWASACLPQEGDDAEAVRLRVDTAEQKFKTRLAEVCILREANDRAWRDDLEDLEYSLPTPRYATYVDGTALVPVGTKAMDEALTEEGRLAVSKITAGNLTPREWPSSARVALRAEVPASLIVRTDYADYDDVHKVSDWTIKTAAHDRFGAGDVSILASAKTPIIRFAS